MTLIAHGQRTPFVGAAFVSRGLRNIAPQFVHLC